MEQEIAVQDSGDLPAASRGKGPGKGEIAQAPPRKFGDAGAKRPPSSELTEPPSRSSISSNSRPKRLAFLDEIRARGRLSKDTVTL